MILRLGEVVLIRMQFYQAAGAKVRPAVVLLDVGDDDFVAAPITSQPRQTEYDFAIRDWPAAGLNVASYARIHKLTVLTKSEVIRNLAIMSARDRTSLSALLCRTFCNAVPGDRP
jgi:mRNA interferase MazF